MQTVDYERQKMSLRRFSPIDEAWLRYFSKNPAEHDLKRLPIRAQEVLQTKHIPVLRENSRSGKPLHGPLRGYFSYDFWVAGVSYRIAYEITKKQCSSSYD